MKLGIITGSTRTGNVGAAVGDWVVENLSDRTDIEIADLRVADFDLDFVSEAIIPGQANGKYESARTTKWAEAITACNAFIFVTAEYNAAPPAAFKNAVDLLFVEWADKPVGFVGYGFHGGERAIKHWRDITANVKLKPADATVNIYLGDEYPDGVLTPAEGRAGELQKLVDELAALNGRD
ncbi:NADPH-dependent FMN reductase [Corynebacterium hansenii]|uniref:NADPH-dependent FMN reductase n=1 Tax=Corynebacterium hansenii TaxID=394964 RepID=A0ABV7ZMR7_9CORY|nr:NADPH-dependent FMN reductase [Corynebacterium hansenii]WJZ00421.1 NADPH-dependent FMN reductase [Corynebacterium hansenii]